MGYRSVVIVNSFVCFTPHLHSQIHGLQYDLTPRVSVNYGGLFSVNEILLKDSNSVKSRFWKNKTYIKFFICLILTILITEWVYLSSEGKFGTLYWYEDFRLLLLDIHSFVRVFCIRTKTKPISEKVLGFGLWHILYFSQFSSYM